MASVAKLQLLCSVEPVLVGRSIGTSSGFPQPMGKDGHILLSRAAGTAINGDRMRVVYVLVRLLRMLTRLPGTLMTGLMVLLFTGLGSSKMGVRGAIVRLSGPLMMLVA